MDHWTDKPNPEFEQWWATKTAEGYQYGRGALENVRFGFEGAQEARWQPIETAPKDAELLLLYDEQEESVRAGFWDAVEVSPAAWTATETQGLTCGIIKPTHWMPLPDPPSLEQGESS